MASFALPEGTLGRFAVVKLWPGVNAAEDEFIARLKVAASGMGLECVEITPDGRLCELQDVAITHEDTDFVIHLHFETPKAYDVFSFVALWNPLQFYFDWGYRKFTDHLATHDDFISCGSASADNHLKRQIIDDPTRLPAKFHVYHSLAEPILAPTLGEKKIFYIGMNWERVNNTKGRHHELLTELDRTDSIRIFGPKDFHGVEPWKGFKCYVGPLPFDGRSAIYEINKSGIALVFSSDAHKDAELMSARLCESAAAGAVIIVDEHPFARRHFGNTLLYVDPASTSQTVSAQVISHLQWIRSHPSEALELARRAQAIFKEKFLLSDSIAEIYHGLGARKQELMELRNPKDASRQVTLYFLLAAGDKKYIEQHIASMKAQDYPNCRAVFVIDEFITHHTKKACISQITRALPDADIISMPLLRRIKGAKMKGAKRFGDLMLRIIEQDAKFSAQYAVCFIGSNEKLFSQHVSGLLAAMERDGNAMAAYSDLLCRHKANDGQIHHDFYKKVDLLEDMIDRPQGYARFLFMPKVFTDERARITLPYLDFHAASWLAMAHGAVASKRATAIVSIQDSYHMESFAFDQEADIMNDVTPALMQAAEKTSTYKSALMEKFLRLKEDDKRHMFAQMFRTLPLPGFFYNIFINPYLGWARKKIRARQK